MHCRFCGCTDEHACFNPTIGSCSWYAPGLCTHCAMVLAIADGVFELAAPEPCERALSYGGIVLA